MVAKSTANVTPLPKEHFGFTDGFGDPVVRRPVSAGGEAAGAVGRGKTFDGRRSWAPLATGEFLLGYPDEAQEMPGAAMPIEFSRNGTFMAYRKLHENVGAFDAYLDRQAGRYARAVRAVAQEDARRPLIAKMVGRWSDGVPLTGGADLRGLAEFNAAAARRP